MTEQAMDAFLKKVYRMRGLQREMRKTRALSPKEKEELTRLEREVDNRLLEEQKRQKSGQSEMF